MSPAPSFRRPAFANLHYAVIQGLYWALMAVYLAFGAAYLYDNGLNSLQTGLVFAAAGLLSAALQPMIAARADRSAQPGAVRMLSLILIAPAAALLLIVWLVPMPVWLRILCYAPVWILMMAVQFLFSALAMEYPNAGYSLNYGAGRAIGSLGFALASYIFGFVVARFGTARLLPIGFALSLLLLAALLFWRSPPLAAQETPEESKGAGFFRRYPRFLVLIIGTILCMTPYSMVCNFLVRIVESVGGGSVELGTAVMICGLCEIPVMFVSVWLNRRLGSYVLMIAAAVMLSAKMLMFALAGSVAGLYIAELFQLISYPLLMGIMVYYVNGLMAPRDRVRGQALMALTQTVACACGALLGGLLLDALGVKGLLYVSLGVSVAGSIVMIGGTEKVKTPSGTDGRSDP